jgi:hypothetical protein
MLVYHWYNDLSIHKAHMKVTNLPRGKCYLGSQLVAYATEKRFHAYVIFVVQHKSGSSTLGNKILPCGKHDYWWSLDW